MEAAIFHGSLPFMMENINVSRGGRGVLDSFRAQILCSADWETDARALGFEIDKRLGSYASLWVKSMVPDEQAEDVVSVQISGEGLANTGDRRQRTMKSGEQQTSVGPHEKVVIVWSKEERGEDPESEEPLDRVKSRRTKLDADGEPVLKSIVTPSGTLKQWVISEAEVAVIDTYFVTSKPAMNVVGTVFAPVNAPTVPPYQWGGYGEQKRGRHPNGWVLVDRDVEEISYFSDTIGLWRVVDNMVFRHPDFPE
jgi:hypothetical protein